MIDCRHCCVWVISLGWQIPQVSADAQDMGDAFTAFSDFTVVQVYHFFLAHPVLLRLVIVCLLFQW